MLGLHGAKWNCMFLLSRIIRLYICDLYCTGSLKFCIDTVNYYNNQLLFIEVVA